jgi:hypothetical protein
MITLQCLDLTVSLTATPACLEDEFAVLYSGFLREHPSATSVLELCFERCEHRYRLFVNGVATTCASVRELFVCASIEIDRACIAASSNTRLLFHASSAARESRGALIVGPSSAGKSTLAAALTLAGLEYVGDEVIGVPPRPATMSAYPKPFKLDGHARQRLARAFARDDVGTDPATEDLVAPSRWGAFATAGTRVTPALVVVPEVADGAAVTLEKLSRADVAEVLADQCFNFPAWGPRGLTAVADLARTCEGVRLRFGDLAETAATLDRLLS